MIYPGYLYFLFALFIPILIHLLSRKRIKEEFFSSLEFILKRSGVLRRYIYLREPILMLIRMGMIFSLVMALVMKTIPFSFFSSLYGRKIIDTSISTEGRIKEDGVPSICRSGVADMFRTLNKYRYGTLISDMQRVSFKEILEKKVKFPLVDLKPLPQVSSNSGIVKADYAEMPKGKTLVSFLLRHKGPPVEKTITLSVDGSIYRKKVKVFSKYEDGFLLNLPHGFHKITLKLDRDSIPFDDVYYLPVFLSGSGDFVIFSDALPSVLESALDAMGYGYFWTTKPGFVQNKDLFIIDSIGNVYLDGLMEYYRGGIVSVGEGVKTSLVNVKKVGLKYSRLKFNGYYTPEPIPYKYRITGGEIIAEFENGDPAAVYKDGIVFLPFSIQEREISLHTYYLPFLHYILNRIGRGMVKKIFSDFYIKGPGEVITHQGEIYRLNKGEGFVVKERGFYTVKRGNATYLYGVNPPDDEYDLTPLNNEEKRLIFTGRAKDGTIFFLLLFLVLFGLEYLMERRSYG